MFDTLSHEGVGEVHVAHDPNTGLKAIIAIHSTTLGPALGGCRFVHYDTEEDALADACRLAHSMSYKAALAGLNSGGGKAVILKPPHEIHPKQRTALLKQFGQFVDSLSGRYITAVDSGTTSEDMDIIAEQTPYTTSTTASGDPSPFTAAGVIAGIKAAVAHKFNQRDLRGLHFAVQGLGNVGGLVAEQLARAGGKITVADLDYRRCQRFYSEYGAEIKPAKTIHSTHCDVFVPCALGGVINNTSLSELHCEVIAGSANNQLSEDWLDHNLHRQGILYAPDYVINAGGLIYCTLQRTATPLDKINQKIQDIGNTLDRIFSDSDAENTPPSRIAARLAEDRLYGSVLTSTNTQALAGGHYAANSH